jgi:hypothetical protein
MALAVAGSTPYHAKGAGNHGGGKHSLVDNIAADLALTDAQMLQVQPFLDAAKFELKAIHKDTRAKVQALTQGQSATDIKPQIRAIHQDARARSQTVLDGLATKMTPFLSPEQQNELQLMRQQGFRQHVKKVGA